MRFARDATDESSALGAFKGANCNDATTAVSEGSASLCRRSTIAKTHLWVRHFWSFRDFSGQGGDGSLLVVRAALSDFADTNFRIEL
jgi:hypothetical protein